jgi:hypothetical protein
LQPCTGHEIRWTYPTDLPDKAAVQRYVIGITGLAFISG